MLIPSNTTCCFECVVVVVCWWSWWWCADGGGGVLGRILFIALLSVSITEAIILGLDSSVYHQTSRKYFIE